MNKIQINAVTQKSPQQSKFN